MSDTENNLITLIDLLDLDEETVDSHLRKLMTRKTFSNKHLSGALTLMQYKLLINSQDGDECDNCEEYNFLAKLFSASGEWNLDLVRKITACVLCLQPSSLVTKAEHLLQQLLCKLFKIDEDVEQSTLSPVFYLTVCNGTLDAVIKNDLKISLMLLELPIEIIFLTHTEDFQSLFLMETVPLLAQATLDYHVLDEIWAFIKKANKNSMCLKILSTLSEFYLPLTEPNRKPTIESNVVHENQFWQIILCGMNSYDPFERKTSIYLAKRSIDHINEIKKDVNTSYEGKLLFEWKIHDSEELNLVWCSFFILLESLEETQSNIVLPSIKLFDTIQNIGSDWLDCVFKLGLRHDNCQVRLKCMEYRIKHKISSLEQVRILLEALNDVNIYSNEQGADIVKTLVLNEDKARLLSVIPEVNFSPIPLYHISNALEKVDVDMSLNEDVFIGHICDILRIPCNEVPLRHHIHLNLFSIVVKNYKHISFGGFSKVVNALPNQHRLKQLDELLIRFCVQACFEENEKLKILNSFIVHLNGSVVTVYHCLKGEDFKHFILEQIDMKFENIQQVLKRQYCNRTHCLNDFMYVSKIYRYCQSHKSLKEVHDKIVTGYQSLLQYAFELLSIEENLSNVDILNYLELCSVLLAQSAPSSDVLRVVSEYYQLVYTIVKDSKHLQQKVMSLNVLNQMLKNNYDVVKIRHGIETSVFIDLIKNIHSETLNGDGILKNMLQKELCITLDTIIEKELMKVESNISNIIEFIENITESCGYDPLPVVIKVINKILPVIVESKMKFNVTRFIERMWNEMKSIKTNELHNMCMKQFIALITQDCLLQLPKYSNIVTMYCAMILDNAAATPTPLNYLINAIYNMELTEDLGYILFIYHEILLFAPVPKKDERITRRTIQNLLKHNTESPSHFNCTELIQATAIRFLLKISNINIVQQLMNLITKKIETIFKNLKRYHANSHAHRVAQAGLQHVLFMLMVHGRRLETDDLVPWAVQLLCKLPHQTSVRTCLEWVLCLCFYLKGLAITKQNLKYIRFDEIPSLSQLTIIYLLAKHTISHSLASGRTDVSDGVDKEYEFCMDFLLSHTMGQLFNVRLQAQYSAKNLYELCKQNNEKYNYTMRLIEDNFKHSSSEKSLIKLQEDYFANRFDIVRSLTPGFIYNKLPKYFSENNDFDSIRDINIASIIETMKKNTDFKSMCNLWSVYNEDVIANVNRTLPPDSEICDEESGSIQKKYIPWKNMSDVASFGERKATPSELIVVASLVAKLPNLGGLARTGEVLGVRGLVVPSLRQLQDRQFQGLSMSAERWLPISEVRPGRPLKEYLLQRRREGYRVVAAEQTSASVPLQAFRFPSKTVLVLGHEKEGIPCDLLPLMDACVEVPQRGVLRSLNVHVTAAIFVWEYSRQNLLG